MHVAPSSAASRGRCANQSSGPSSPRVPAPPQVLSCLHADEAQAELLVLPGLGHRRRLEHRVGPRLGLREGHHLADVRLAGEERGPAIDAEGDPAVRRRAVLECVEDGPELLAHPLARLTLEQERALEELAPVDPDRPATELPAVEREVVLERPRAAGRVRGRRLRRIAGCRHQQLLVLGQDAAERVVGRVPAAASRRPTGTSGSDRSRRRTARSGRPGRAGRRARRAAARGRRRSPRACRRRSGSGRPRRRRTAR